VCKFIGKSNEQILCKLSKSEILRLYSIVHVAMETVKKSNFTCQSKSFISIFSLAKFQLVSCNLSLVTIWQMTYTVEPRLTATSLLRPLFLGCLTKTAIHFLVKKALVNMANFFGPMVAVLTGFHCTYKLQKLCSATLNWFLKSLKKYHKCANPIIHCICCCSCFIRNNLKYMQM